MPRRLHLLVNNEIYHVFNRSVGHEIIFSNKRNLQHTLDLLDYYRFTQKMRYSQYKTLTKEFKMDYESNFKEQLPLVEIYAYAFMPNHYHLLLKQLQNGGIGTFIRILQNSFAKYFNIKFDRHGALFQSTFKAKRVETDEEFVHTSRYIHLNPVTSFLIEFNELSIYPWTSFPIYSKDSLNTFVNTNEIIGRFKTREKYVQFVADQADYQRRLGIIKHLILD
ncbi:transposase [Candidatus Gottesmanbacteria bacterium]|nr:transposase [Candidatus Gottesmanbacteria bacterium]